MNCTNLLELLADGPVIVAVKDDAGLEAALESDVAVLFLLYGDILTIGEKVARIHQADKKAFVHLDLIDGLSAREISAPGGPLSLTPKEFAILEHLMLHPGRWVSQEELVEHIWDAEANPFSNAVRMHISSLRKKLRERLGYDPIQTKIGQGYRLAGEEPI